MKTKILTVLALVGFTGQVHASNCRINKTKYDGGIYPFASFVGPLEDDEIKLDLNDLTGKEIFRFEPSGGWIALPSGLKRSMGTQEESFSAEGPVPGQGNVSLKINVSVIKLQFASRVTIEGFTSYKGESTRVKDTLSMECK